MLKHLTLSSGCMQKQQWMLHLYWIEVIRRHFLSFHFPSPPPPNRFSPESLVRSPGLRSAEAHRAEEAGRSGLLSPTPSPLFFSSSPALKSKGVGGDNILLLLLLPPLFLQKIAQANSANEKKKQKHLRRKKKKKTRSVSRYSAVRSGFRRKTRVSFPRRCKPQRQASPFTRCLFPPHRDAHSPPPTISVTTATTITTTAISPPQPSLPSPAPPCQIRLAPALFWLT